MDAPAQIKTWLTDRARELGFAQAGVAPAGPVPTGEAFLAWLAAGHHASMAYMARNVRQRCDVRANWPWARSVLCLAAGCAGPDDADRPVARYARGRDYHKLLKRRCHVLADELAGRVPGVRTCVCVDTAPVLERALAAAAGLGWIGVNSCLTHPRYGSYLLLAEIVLSLELPPDAPLPDSCGQCRRCLEACPNGAIVAPRVVDAGRCISWATIEHRGPLPPERLDLRGRLFGCDICQQVCPYNRRPEPGLEELTRETPLAAVTVEAVLAWTEHDWDAATRGSTGRRATHAMFLRNACLVAGQARLAATRPHLLRLRKHADPAVAAAAQWALRATLSLKG